MSLLRAHRFAIALALLVAQAASFAHLAIVNHMFSAEGHLIETCASQAPSPEGVSASDGMRGSDERCTVFEAAQTASEVAALPVELEVESSKQLAGGNVRRGFVRSALIDAPKASPPSRV